MDPRSSVHAPVSERLGRLGRSGLAAILSASTMVACGTNNAGVPPALLQAIEHPTVPEGGVATDYPAGPYGTRVGDTVQNLCFQGWSNPTLSNYDPNKLERICVGDVHEDPAARLLLVESAALWCESCQFEYQGSGSRPSLAQNLATRQAKGFRVLGTLFQNARQGPASATDAAAWAATYTVEFPFVVDDQHLLGLFTSPNEAPFNLLIDTRTMKIVLEVNGDEPLVTFGAVDAFLAKPAE